MAIPVQIVLADLQLYNHLKLKHGLLPKLDGAERAHYKTFTSAHRRYVWLAGRALLLAALRRQFGEAAPVGLRTDQTGAPHYRDDTVRISLSHSGNQIAAAISDAPVGVDIEKLRSRALLEQIGHVFCTSEVAQLCELPAERRTDVFYALWTLKEAACKAASVSLWDGLPNACFDLEAGGFRMCPPFPEEGWQFATARLEPDWRLAVALHNASRPLSSSCWRLTSERGWQPQPLSMWTVFPAR